jgi:UV DNA damage repair endonuclease
MEAAGSIPEALRSRLILEIDKREMEVVGSIPEALRSRLILEIDKREMEVTGSIPEALRSRLILETDSKGATPLCPQHTTSEQLFLTSHDLGHMM